MIIEQMRGDLIYQGHRLARAGFMIGEPPKGYELGPSAPIYTRGMPLSQKTTDLIERMQRVDIERMDLTGDMGSIVNQLGSSLDEIRRALTSSTIPVRENLEAPARILVPLETPMRNKIPRVPGAGSAAQWRQLASLGGGYGFATTVTSGATSATQTVASTAGIQPGDVVQFVTATTGVPIGGTTVASLRTVSSITSPTVLVLAASVATVTGDLMVNTGKAAGDAVTGSTTAAHVPGRPAGAGPASGLTAGTYFGRSFFAETGAPAEKTETYTSKTAAYKLLGAFGSITGFAMAALN